MTVNLHNADNALKTLYLDAISYQLDNNVNPLLAAITKTTNDVCGKEIRKLVSYGINGGIGAGAEDTSLPDASGNKYVQFASSLKNLYGVIEISDKAIRASENSSGAFVSLLNAEMEGLLKASIFNFGRMLFGDGSGRMATAIKVANNCIYLENTKGVMEGMLVDFMDINGGVIGDLVNRKVKYVNREENYIMVEGVSVSDRTFSSRTSIAVQNSYNNEIVGLGALFNNNTSTLYGVKRADNPWLLPYVKEDAGEISELDIQIALDSIEEKGGRPINFIVCSWGVRRALQQLFSANKRVIDTMELNGGFKAMSYNGIPIVADRFCPDGTMYLLNTEDFALHQLCDWQWLADDDGRVLKQVPGRPVYTATLVKYADLMCAKPYGQGVIKGITEL